MKVRIRDKSMPVAIGKITTTLSFFKIISPGSLNRRIFGNNRKIQPTTMKKEPRIRKNLAGLCTECGRISLLTLWVHSLAPSVLNQAF
jgi:hypothetical protein